jgi:hypothetical protein
LAVLGLWILGLMLTRQGLYHLGYSASPCFSFLIPTSMFKGISQCIPAESCEYALFWSVQSSLLLSPLLSYSYYSTVFSSYCYVLYLHKYYIFRYCDYDSLFLYWVLYSNSTITNRFYI